MRGVAWLQIREGVVKGLREVQGWFKDSSVSSSVSRFCLAGRTGGSTGGGALHVNTKMFSSWFNQASNIPPATRTQCCRDKVFLYLF